MYSRLWKKFWFSSNFKFLFNSFPFPGIVCAYFVPCRANTSQRYFMSVNRLQLQTLPKASLQVWKGPAFRHVIWFWFLQLWYSILIFMHEIKYNGDKYFDKYFVTFIYGQTFKVSEEESWLQIKTQNCRCSNKFQLSDSGKLGYKITRE